MDPTESPVTWMVLFSTLPRWPVTWRSRETSKSQCLTPRLGGQLHTIHIHGDTGHKRPAGAHFSHAFVHLCWKFHVHADRKRVRFPLDIPSPPEPKEYSHHFRELFTIADRRFGFLHSLPWTAGGGSCDGSARRGNQRHSPCAS